MGWVCRWRRLGKGAAALLYCWQHWDRQGEPFEPASPVCTSGAHPAHVQSTPLYPMPILMALLTLAEVFYSSARAEHSCCLCSAECVLAPVLHSQAQEWWKLDPGSWIVHPLLFSSQTVCLGLHPHCGSSRRQTRFSCSLPYCLFSHCY